MARRIGPVKSHRYTVEFKLKAVKLSWLKGVQVQDVAEALDIHPILLTRWRKEAREGRLRGRVKAMPDLRAEGRMAAFSTLKRRYALLREEHEILKKAIRFCSAPRQRSSDSSKRNGTGLE
jgi:transposase